MSPIAPAAVAPPGPRPPAPGPCELLLAGRVHKLPCPLGAGADGGYWLNPALVEAWGKTWLLPRCNRMPSFLGIAELETRNPEIPKSPNPFHVGPLRPLFRLSEGCIAEDPRAVLHPDGRRIIVYYVGIDAASNPNCSMFRGLLQPGRDSIEVLEQRRLRFDDPWESHRAVLRAFGVHQQKNWTPFFQDGRELCIYAHCAAHHPGIRPGPRHEDRLPLGLRPALALRVDPRRGPARLA